MSDEVFDGPLNWAEAFDVYDWDDVIAGTGSITLDTILDEGESYHFKNHPGGNGGVAILEGTSGKKARNLVPLNIGRPQDGEALPEDAELYYGGTTNLNATDGNEVIAPVGIDTLSPVINIDDDEIADNLAKFSTKHRMESHPEYENFAEITATSLQNATEELEVDWAKLTATANATECAKYFTGTVGETKEYVEFELMYGKLATNDSSAIVCVSGGSSVLWTLRIRWDNQTTAVVGGTGAIDFSSVFSDDGKKVKVRVGGDHAALTSVATYRLRTGYQGSNNVIGDYIYFRRIMIVEGIDYPVPYTKGVHPASMLSFNKDWNKYTSLTLHIWFYANDQSTDQFIFDARSANNPNYAFYMLNTSLGWQIKSGDGTTPTGITLTGVNDKAWNHALLVFVSGASFTAYINGGSAQVKTTNIPNIEDVDKALYLGQRHDGTSQLLGGIAEFAILDGVDASDAHYLANKPYFKASVIYSKNGVWEINQHTGYEGPKDDGEIVLDEEINGQWVTMYDTGKMVNSGSGAVPGTYSIPFVSKSYEEAGTGDYLTIGRWK